MISIGLTWGFGGRVVKTLQDLCVWVQPLPILHLSLFTKLYKWVLATKSSRDITLRWTRIFSSGVAIFIGASCYMYLNIVVMIIIIIIISFVIIIISIYNNFYYYDYFFKSLFPLVVTLCDLSDANTTVLICYEERTTGNKPLLEKKFHQVQMFSSY